VLVSLELLIGMNIKNIVYGLVILISKFELFPHVSPLNFYMVESVLPIFLAGAASFPGKNVPESTRGPRGDQVSTTDPARTDVELDSRQQALLHKLKVRYQRNSPWRQADKRTMATLHTLKRGAIRTLNAKDLTALAQILEATDIDIPPQWFEDALKDKRSGVKTY